MMGRSLTPRGWGVPSQARTASYAALVCCAVTALGFLSLTHQPDRFAIQEIRQEPLQPYRFGILVNAAPIPSGLMHTPLGWIGAEINLRDHLVD
jgi:hypothetical protein